MAYERGGGRGDPYNRYGGLLGKAAKRRTEKSAANKSLASNVTGAVGAAGAAYLSGGNPAAISAGFQGGKVMGQGAYEVASGEGISGDTTQQAIGAGLSGLSAKEGIDAAKAAKVTKLAESKHQKELLEALRSLGLG